MEGIWNIILPELREFHERGMRPILLPDSGPSALRFFADQVKVIKT